MTPTDKLRQMLTEAGVEWWSEKYYKDECTIWRANGMEWRASEQTDGKLLIGCTSLAHLTPAQAIDATVGRGTCQMECAGRPTERTLDVMGVYFCSKCGSPIYNDCMPSYCIYCGAEVTL